MALNYSHKPIFPAYISEDDLVSPLRIVNGCLVDGVPGKNEGGCSWPRCRSLVDTEEQENCRGNLFDRSSSSESTSKDIVDLLPTDPFGMDMQTTFTAITGWLEDLEVGYGRYVGSNGREYCEEDYGLFAGWNLIWNDVLTFQSLSGNLQSTHKLSKAPDSLTNDKMLMGIDSYPCNAMSTDKLNVASELNKYMKDRDFRYDYIFQKTCNIGEIIDFHYGNRSSSSELICEEKVEGVPNYEGVRSSSSELLHGEKVEGASNSEGVPHEALAFALGHLGVKDLLSVEMVCTSLCSTVRGDPLLWMNINIDQPLSDRITDAVLVELTTRAHGNLQCLTMVECSRITDNGLQHVLENNPQLEKLCVPGCTRLSIEGIVNNLKMHNSNKDVKGIKYLRIGGIYGATHEHFEELKFLLGADSNKLGSSYKKHFYHRGNFYLPYDDNRPIDIEICPRCEKIRLVYDCPSDGCQVDGDYVQACRACTLCIARCAQCGRCINDTVYEETFCLELLCSDCFSSCLERKVGPSRTLQQPSFKPVSSE